MPDLGKYAIEVNSAYLASFIIIAVLVVLSLARSRRVRVELEEMEALKPDA